ncbi:MAG: hypothetical protein ACHQD9_00255 [Chitinophagales bacterium]
MKKFFLLLFFSSASLIAIADSIPEIRSGAFCEMFQPISTGDSALMKSISVFNEEIKVDLYSGYAAISANYWFNNSSEKNVQLEVGIPQNENKNLFTDVYWLRIMINHHEPIVATDTLINSHWKIWNITFQPGVNEVNLFYGMKTDGASLISEKKSIRGNCFRYDFSNDRYWKNDLQKSEIWLRMNDGYTTRDVLGLLPDKKFLGGNSILHGWTKELVTDSSSQILLWYRSIDSLPLSVSSISWEKKYDNLKQWNPDEKILRTLAAFSATDFEGKALEEENDHAQMINRLKWIGGILFAFIVITTFIWSQRRKKTF